MTTDTAFQMAASNVRFGQGTTAEIGMDLRDMGVKRTLVVMDPVLVDLPTGEVVRNALRTNHIGFDVFTEVSVEPTDASFQRAAEVACEGGYDSFVAVGGGSAIDTCKAANLYASYPAEFFTYVNAPIGEGKPVPGPTNPLIAIPTTAGTGSETTGVAIFDYVKKHAKTGIAHRYLKPTLGIIDSDNTATMPAAVAASSGLDVLSHALESYTALPFDQRPKPNSPLERPAYQGTNPISDIWAIKALELMAEYLPRAYADTTDANARMNMLMASTIAGIGFGNAGVHLPHGMSYPVAGTVKSFNPNGYEVDHPIIPHGMSVILNTPAVVRFTAPSDPKRHLIAAQALGADISGVPDEAAGELLAERVIHFMKLTDMPNGLSAVGYDQTDIPALVQGTLPQHRVTKLSPIAAGEAELTQLFEDSMVIY